MKLVEQALNGLILFELVKFADERGAFLETYNRLTMDRLTPILSSLEGQVFLQDNQSVSKKGVIRGLHFQAPPYDQGKLVRVISGAILDVAVDIRRKSPTYGKHYSTVLSSDNNRTLWIPSGFAHGFLSMEKDTVVSYKCTNTYNKESEGTILFNDTSLDIDWYEKNRLLGVTTPIVSERDKAGELFSSFETPFK